MLSMYCKFSRNGALVFHVRSKVACPLASYKACHAWTVVGARCDLTALSLCGRSLLGAVLAQAQAAA